MLKIEKKKLGVIGANKKPKEMKSHKSTLRDPMFVGMDPSYNNFAIVILDQDANIVDQQLFGSTKTTEVEDRLIELEKKYDFIPHIVSLHSICIEGPSYSSNGAFILQMGALHYMIRIMFKRQKVNFKVIAPTTLKKFVTGSGRAKKDLMLLKVYKRWGVEFSDDNLADAYSLARMALEEYNNGNKKLPEQDSGGKGDKQK